MDLSPLITALSREIADAVAERLPAPVVLPEQDGIDLWRAYTAKEAAHMLGISARSLQAITEAELRTVYVGPTRRSKRYLGINLLCYLHALEQVDTEALARDQRRQFISRSPAPVMPMRAGKKQRVL